VFIEVTRDNGSLRLFSEPTVLHYIVQSMLNRLDAYGDSSSDALSAAGDGNDEDSKEESKDERVVITRQQSAPLSLTVMDNDGTVTTATSEGDRRARRRTVARRTIPLQGADDTDVPEEQNVERRVRPRHE
jgi:hypothetical protein